MARLSIIIATYNSAADIGPCLGSLASARPAAAHDITVVDNASTDRTAEVVRSRPDVRLLTLPANVGFARANNHAIRATTGELILLLNPDTLVRPGAIDTLVATLDTAPSAAAAGPRLVDLDGHVELSFGRTLGPLNELRQKVLNAGHHHRWPVIADYVERMTRTPGEREWVSGACLLVRRSDAEAVGLLDEGYFLYGEDVDFCAALRRRGRAVVFEPRAEVVHLRGQSRRSVADGAEPAYRRSHLRFYAKHHPRWYPWLRTYLSLRGRLPPDEA